MWLHILMQYNKPLKDYYEIITKTKVFTLAMLKFENW